MFVDFKKKIMKKLQRLFPFVLLLAIMAFNVAFAGLHMAGS